MSITHIHSYTHPCTSSSLFYCDIICLPLQLYSCNPFELIGEFYHDDARDCNLNAEINGQTIDWIPWSPLSTSLRMPSIRVLRCCLLLRLQHGHAEECCRQYDDGGRTVGERTAWGRGTRSTAAGSRSGGAGGGGGTSDQRCARWDEGRARGGCIDANESTLRLPDG